MSQKIFFTCYHFTIKFHLTRPDFSYQSKELLSQINVGNLVYCRTVVKISGRLSATMKLTLILLCFVSLAYAHRNYQSSIPNGHSVPNPCPSDGIWNAVGHQNVNHGGARNSFGQVTVFVFRRFYFKNDTMKTLK